MNLLRKYAIMYGDNHFFQGGITMTEKEQKKAAKEFAERWKGRGYR